MDEPGSLVCVGLGMMLGAHLSPRAQSELTHADVVFAGVSDPLVELWLQEMHRDVRSLQPFYADGKSRQTSYREMADAILTEVRAGKRVCGAFYGHPGVFSRIPHDAIARARDEGYDAWMEPGISAEDCLYADLGIDPGNFGCQHYEASQFIFYERRIDTSAYLVLWQVGIAGDRSLRRFATSVEHRQLLVDRLAEDYPLDHLVVAYEAATLPIAEPRIVEMRLREVAAADLKEHTTLVVPPASAMRRNTSMLERVNRLETSRPGADGLRANQKEH